MTAFRAEAYGKLSWMCFLIHFSTYLGIDINCEINNFCDNIQVVNLTKLPPAKSAREAIRPDYDVIQQISLHRGSLTQIASKLRPCQHVKGHQDKSTTPCNLSLQAKLNIRADQIASHTLQVIRSCDTSPKMFELPACGAYLINGGETQTSKEQWTCRWKWSDLRIQSYHCDRLNVSYEALHRINWEAFRKARKRLKPNEQVFATKMMTRWLPTGHRMQKYGGLVTACHQCGEDETVDHLFQCKGHAWSKLFIPRFDQYLTEINTDSNIRRALVSGVTRWLDADCTTKESRCPKLMLQCTRLQDEVGWNLVLCGLLDENWSALQAQACNEKSTKRRQNVDMEWSVKLSCWLIREARSLWLSRNNEVHRPDDGKSKSEAEILEQVRNLYKTANEMSQHDRILFDEPIEARLSQPIPTLRAWVKNTIPTANRCIRDFKAKLLSKQSDIRRFFLPRTKLNDAPPAQIVQHKMSG